MSVVLKNARCKIYLFGDVLEKYVLWENVFLGSFDFKSSHVFFCNILEESKLPSKVIRI